jgi:PEP-CTERM motif
MKHWKLLVGFLCTSLISMASVISVCPGPQCGVTLDTETVSGNTATVHISADFSSATPGTATFTLNPLSLLTAGPVRSGQVFLIFLSNGDFADGSSSSATGAIGAYTCSSAVKVQTFCYNNVFEPITLGQSIPVSMQLTITAGSNPNFIGGGNRDLFLVAQFFENDLTPVTVSFGSNTAAVPEPGTFWSAGFALIAMAGVGSWRKRCQMRA